ncbi:MAG: hypothetical protein QMD13_03025 [Candidatus Bathyarchaeia archaeon]|nr:hypothetical protein [Candidatus Bathyarchaeia archaeon]
MCVVLWGLGGVFGVTFGTYLGAKIMKHEPKTEITKYIQNEIPHLLESPEAKAKARELARTFIHEVWNIMIEELGIGK